MAEAPGGVELIEAIHDDITRVTADAAYDTVAVYDAAGAPGATVVVPPAKTARVSRRKPRSSARDRTINKVKKLGRRRWKKESGYHRQARVETAFFRYCRSSAMVFEPGQLVGERPRRCSRATS